MRLRTPLYALFFLPLVAACGGPQGAPAASAAVEAPGRAAGESASTSSAEQASALRCDDGSCFRCGEGICPSGFYCAVHQGRQGCAWIPRCAAGSSCACLAPVTTLDGGCRCEERDGGVYVTCG